MQLVSLELPAMPPPRPPVSERLCRPCEITLGPIARRLGIADQALRTIIAKVRLLAEHEGFPLPKNPRFVKCVRQVGAQSIDARSVWDRDAVELWFENDRPPQEGRAVAEARRRTAREDMAGRLHLIASNA